MADLIQRSKVVNFQTSVQIFVKKTPLKSFVRVFCIPFVTNWLNFRYTKVQNYMKLQLVKVCSSNKILQRCKIRLWVSIGTPYINHVCETRSEKVDSKYVERSLW